MPIQTTINTLSGTSPFDVYICQFNLTGCFYIDTITSGDIPYTFTIPAPYDTAESYCVKVVDDQGCVISGCSIVNPTPTPTNTVTPTNTPTISLTPSVTPTISVTPSVTPTLGVTQTPTPTQSVTPTISLSPGSTQSPTPTPTITPTETVTITPTPSITQTITSTVTPTPTRTPTLTPTITSSVTPTPSPVFYYYFVREVTTCTTGVIGGAVYTVQSTVPLLTNTYVLLDNISGVNCAFQITGPTTGPSFDDTVSFDCGSSLPVSCCC